MPSGFVRKISKETGKSVREIEKLWGRAREIASEEFGKNPDDFGAKEYAYMTGIVKNMLGLDEERINPANFLKSEKSAKEYIKETLSSGSFGSIGEPGGLYPPSNEFDPTEEDDEKELLFGEEKKKYETDDEYSDNEEE